MARQLQKGLTDKMVYLSLVRNDDNRSVILTPPTTYGFSPGITNIDVETTTRTGIGVIGLSYKSKVDESLDVSIGTVDPEVISLLTDRQLIKSTQTFFYPFSTFLNIGQAARLEPAANSSEVGFGVAVDAVCDASGAYIGLQTEAIAQQPFAGFNSATAPARSFAIGANAEILFSNDLIGCDVVVNVPITLTNALNLGEKNQPTFRLTGIVQNIDRELIIYRCPFAQLVRGSDQISPGSPAALKFRFVANGGCTTYSMIFSQLSVPC
jgi:hypothetical protein